jgi:hypothetical protein|tara:strand:+ start:543 stop:971 length:429 start_codon:yes stop_codon:yes gene_type:complete
MVKKLKILIPILLLNSISFSQKDTSKICFDYNIAKNIAIDLVKGDSAIAELQKTHELVYNLDQKSLRQDSIIQDFTKKDANYTIQIQNYIKIDKEQYSIISGLEDDVSTLQKSNNRLKKGLKWLGAGFAATLVSLLTLITLK